ncbi:MAG: phage holin family protein [Gracilimonas sp.]
MDDLGKRIKSVTHELKDYIETRLELTLLNIGDHITHLIGKSIQSLIGYTVLAIGLVFGMVALAVYLGEILNEPWAGYAIVSIPFIIGGLILVVLKPKSLVLKIQDQILAEFIDSMNETDHVKELPSKEISKKERE